MAFTLFTCLVIAAIWFVKKTFIIVPMRETVIKEHLGKYAGTLQPGFHFLIPFLDRDAYHHEMREQALDIPSQSCITRDNIQVEVDGIVFLKVVDARKASYGIGNYRNASVNLAQTTMRAEIGKLTVDETFSERERINENIVREIDKASEPWGVKMIRYEIRNITPSKRVIDTMEKQMEAERQKRAAITVSTGQKEATINISEGQKQEAVNLSEGEKIRRINEAEGRAEEIRLVSTATAEGALLIANALAKPGGQLAIKQQVIEQYIREFGNIAGTAQVSVVPAPLANFQGVVEGLGEVTRSTR